MHTNNQPEKRVEQESRDVQIIEARPVDTASDAGRKDHTITVGTLNVGNASPVGGYLSGPFRRRYHKHYHPRHRHGTKHLIADIFLVFVVVGLLGANIYTAFFLAPSLRERVQLTLATTPETVTSGDLVTLTFSYKNDNDAALTDAHLAVLLPKYFSHITATPESFNEQTHTFSLGRIAAGGNGIVAVSGKLIGSVGMDVETGAVLSYGREGTAIVGRNESKGVSFAIPVLRSTVRLSLDFPDDVVHEGNAPFVLRYENMGKPPIGELVLQPSMSDAVQLKESSVPFVDGVFRIANIAQGGHGEIRGSVAIRAGGEETMTFAMKAFVDGTTLLQSEAKKTAHVFYPKVFVSPSHDPAHDTLILGTPFDLAFAYENGEGEDILDLAVTVDLPSALFVRDAKTITTMTKREDQSLALTRAGAKGTISFTLLAKEMIDRKTLFGTGDPIIHIPYVVSYRRVSSPDRLIQFERTDERKIQSDLTIAAFGRYYTPEGDQLGRGPLPPRVNETTLYWVFIPLTNTLSDITDVVVTAELGAHAEWARKGSITLGDPLTYDESTRMVTWRIPRVTKYSGGEYPDVGMVVEVALTPESDDIGKEPVVLTHIRVRGHDTFTNAIIERDAGTVTTQLSVDRKAKERSKVVL
ncbi:MAG: hypothetical protein Q7S16_00900 [bacterium]|nr:hypothetical protein [bacterium]